MHSAVRPRLIASDLDGTLLRSDGTLSERTRAAIVAVEAAGIEMVFVSARPPRWLDGLAHAVGAHGIAICGNGAFVYDVPTQTVIEQYPIEAELLRDLIRDLRLAIPEIAFAVERADGLGREEKYTYWREKPSSETVATLEQLTGSPVGKFLGRCDSMDPVTFLGLVDDVVRGRAEIGFSGASGLAEITAPGVTKAAGLARLCADRAIDASEVWAFGDMPNDLPMIEWAGTGFAVGNGHAEVRALADHIIESNDEDGVARTLETLLS